MTDVNSPLAQSILKQVEYYFSKQNLQNDHYLISKMNPQLYVPLEVVAGFKMLRNLTTDLDLIKRVLRSSTKLQLDESGPQCMVRPHLNTASRTTIILRDIPKDVKEEEIKAIFPEPGKIKSCKQDIGDTWFLSFESEDDCKNAYDATINAQLRGQPVKARIKSENLLKNFFPGIGVPPPEQAPQQPPPFVPSFTPFGAAPSPMPLPYPYLMSAGMYARGAFPPMPPMPPMDFYGMRAFQANPVASAAAAAAVAAPTATLAPVPQPPSSPPPQPPTAAAAATAAAPQAAATGAGAAATTPGNLMQSGGGAPLGGRGVGRGGRGAYGRGRGGGFGRGNNYQQDYQGYQGQGNRPSPKRGAYAGQAKPAPPKLSSSDFPPLPSSSSPTSGYDGPFKRFSKAEIVAVLETLQNQDVPVPPGMPESPAVFSKEMIRTIELLRNIDSSSTETKSERPKTFAEAAISSADIKLPDKPRRAPGTRVTASDSGGSPVEDAEAAYPPVRAPQGGGRGQGRARGRGGRGGPNERRGRGGRGSGFANNQQNAEKEAGTQTAVAAEAAA